MIFIQLVECFLSPRQGSEIENTKHVGYNTYPAQNHERSYIHTALSEIITHRLLIRHTIVILRSVITD